MAGNGARSVAAYVRVSSASQQAGMQRDAIERAARARGDTIAGWYAETFTSSTLQRPKLAILRRDVRAGHVHKLYVYRLDRLARSGIRDTFEVVEEFRRYGCELVSVADGFDLGGPAADVVLAVLAWAAQMERAAIRERMGAARVRVEAEGKSWGRPKKLTIEQESELLALHREGWTTRDLAVKYGISKGTVARTLELCPENPPPSATQNH